MVNKRIDTKQVEFESFKEEFKKWQEKFGLNGYRVYFEHKGIDDCFADITIDQSENIATVRLNSKLLTKDKPHQDIKGNAKHEALHLLVGRLERNARWRYSSSSEISEATEELVHKLEGLIDG